MMIKSAGYNYLKRNNIFLSIVFENVLKKSEHKHQETGA